MARSYWRFNEANVYPSGVTGHILVEISSVANNYSEWQRIDFPGNIITSSAGATTGPYPALEPPAGTDYKYKVYNNTDKFVKFGVCQTGDTCISSIINNCGNNSGTGFNYDPNSINNYWSFSLPSGSSIEKTAINLYEFPSYQTICNHGTQTTNLGQGAFNVSIPIITYNCADVIFGPQVYTTSVAGDTITLGVGETFITKINFDGSELVNDSAIFGLFIPQFTGGDCPRPCIPSSLIPNANSSYTNICPADTVNLASVTISNTPLNTEVKWFNNSVASAANTLSNLVVGAGTYYVGFKNIGEECYSSLKQVSIIINTCNGATLIADIGTVIKNTNLLGSVSTNDTVICTGVKLYRVKVGSEIGGTFIMNGLGNYTYSPTTNFIGNASCVYEVLCDGIILGETTLTINVIETPCIPIAGGVLNGPEIADLNTNINYNITGLTGSIPYTYNAEVINGVIVSGQGTSNVVISLNSSGVVKFTVTNCNGASSKVFTKNITAGPSTCVKTLSFDYNCGTIADVIIRKVSLPNEVNRITSRFGTVVQFTPELGMHDYLLSIKNTDNEVSTYELNSINHV